MTAVFERDVTVVHQELDAARAELLRVVTALSETDLDKSRRGGWSVRAVLDHLIESDWWFSRAVASLREMEAPPRRPTSDPPASVAEAVADFRAAHEALITACEGVDEDAFYRLRKVGPQEYSILSILEISEDHDREPARQIERVVAKR